MFSSLIVFMSFIILILYRSSCDFPSEIARKDTTIFSNRGYFIEKLTAERQKIIV